MRKYRHADYYILLHQMREPDRLEVQILSGNVEKAVRMTLALADKVWTGTIDDEVVCVFGVNPRSILTNEGCPWLLGTKKLDKYPVTFMRHARPYLERMKARYPRLSNLVDVRNSRSVRWLKLLGFNMHQPVAINGGQFYPFSLNYAGMEH